MEKCELTPELLFWGWAFLCLSFEAGYERGVEDEEMNSFCVWGYLLQGVKSHW